MMRRRTKGLNPLQDAEHHIKLGKDKDVFTWRNSNHIKGQGVFSKGLILKGSFILEYRGILYKKKDLKNFGTALNDYTYIFRHRGTDYCIDASSEDGSLGRLVNDDQKPNAKMKKIEVDGMPHRLFSIMDIREGQEITYDHGRGDMPWRSCHGQEMCKPPMAPGSPGTRHPSNHPTSRAHGSGYDPRPKLSLPLSLLKSPWIRLQSKAQVVSPTVPPKERKIVGSQQKAKRPGSGNNDENMDTSEQISSTEADRHISGHHVASRGKCKSARPWTKAEVNAVMRHFKSHIMKGHLACKRECVVCKNSEHPALQNRPLPNIRDYVRNKGLTFKCHMTKLDFVLIYNPRD